MSNGRHRFPLVALTVATVLVGCAGSRSGPSPEVTVFAAASLREAFTDIATAFESQTPGSTVTLNLAGSQILATQLADGAPADVFASADPAQMDRVVAAGRETGPPRIFARNQLTIAVEPGNPFGITGLADLARPDLVVILAAEAVPAGRYAWIALENAGVDVTPDSLEVDVRAVLNRVALGEADAGIVYETDVAAAEGAVEAVPIPESGEVLAEYPIVALADGPAPEAGSRFVDFVLSPIGQGILEDHGFTAP